MAGKKSAVKAEVTPIKKLKTPVGISAWAYLNKPDDSFGKERYRIDQFWPDFATDPKFKEFLTALREMNNTFRKEKGASAQKTPECIKIADEKLAEKVGVPVGTPYMSFETKPRDEEGEGNWAGIPVYNAAGQKDDGVLVYGGDIVKVETKIAGWTLNKDVGIKGYLVAVQLLKSNYNGGAGSSFEAEEEFLNDEDSPNASDSVADALSDEGEDTDAPFDATDDLDTEEEVEAKPAPKSKGKAKAPAKGKGKTKPAAEEADDSDPTDGLL
jgi:hypothetical protein